MQGTEHWTAKGEIRLFLWRKPPAAGSAGARHDPVRAWLIHGLAADFDLAVPGRPDSSVMDWFAARGFDTWCLDNEGYGRSDKKRPINFDISNGADDLEAASAYVLENHCSKKAACLWHLFGRAQGRPVRPAASRARGAAGAGCLVWTGEGSPTLAERRRKAARVPVEEPPRDRPRFRAEHLRARSSRHRGRSDHRGLCHGDPRAGRLGADRHLRRHVLEAPLVDPG
jgi:pimeloyl-ACP methyl ester carboxylesterase